MLLSAKRLTRPTENGPGRKHVSLERRVLYYRALRMVQLFDKDGDGAIIREEMLSIMQAVFKMNETAGLTEPNSLTAEECTDQIFLRLDKDNNGENMEEFIEGALDDDWIRKMLECDPCTVREDWPLKRDSGVGLND